LYAQTSKERLQKSKSKGGEMRFGKSEYAIFALAGSQEGTSFCTVEELVKGNANRICVYSSKGDFLSESHLGVRGSDLEVNASFRRAMVYNYGADSVILFNLEGGLTILENSCEELHFLGFVENRPIIQDVSGRISMLDEATGETSHLGEAPPILAWARDGSLRMTEEGDDSILVANKNGKGLFSISRLGLTCFNPSISIVDATKDILLIESGAGLRLFSANDHQCKLRLESTEDISFEFACLGGTERK
jgi:hypothetical protein